MPITIDPRFSTTPAFGNDRTSDNPQPANGRVVSRGDRFELGGTSCLRPTTPSPLTSHTVFAAASAERAAIDKELRGQLDVMEKELRALSRSELEPNAREARRTALYASLSDFAARASALGPNGRAFVARAAEALYGSDAEIVEAPPGRYALWSVRDSDAPTMICRLDDPNVRPTPDAIDKALSLPTIPPLGSLAIDEMRPSEVPALRHVDAALGGRISTVAGLFDKRELPFDTAPDPSAYLRKMNEVNAKTVLHNPVSMNVLSYNVALLDYKLFGFWSVIESPLMEERRQKIAESVFSGGDSVVMLQELWRDRDVALFASIAEKQGYRAFIGPRTKYTDGVATFIKADLIDPRAPVSHATKIFDAQQAKEWWTTELTTLGLGVGMKRAYHKISFRHPTLGPIDVYNTHMQPTVAAFGHRLHQSRELGLAIAATSAPDHNVLVGGDMNSGPFYARDSLDAGKGSDWWENTIAYPLLQHYGKIGDLVAMGVSREAADDDVELARLRIPPNDGPHYPFTAGHPSNSLYVAQYGSSEHPARIDHLLGRGARGMKVEESGLAFTDDVEVAPGVVTELSDHYGVRAAVSFERA